MSGSRIQCFWLEPMELGRSSLRRYEKHAYEPMPPPSCPQNPMRYHDTDVVLGDIPYPFGTADCDPTPEEIPHDDPRWPKTCHVCGTPFRDEDNWQHNVHRLYSGAPDGKLYTVRDMPPGSMYDATWWPKKGPDGICMHVVLPPAGGLADYWNVDGPSSNGPGWTRTGTIPLVTARPSIQTPRYHGFLTDGFLMEC